MSVKVNIPIYHSFYMYVNKFNTFCFLTFNDSVSEVISCMSWQLSEKKGEVHWNNRGDFLCSIKLSHVSTANSK